MEQLEYNWWKDLIQDQLANPNGDLLIECGSLGLVVTDAVAHPLEQILHRPAQLKFISNGL